MFNYKDLKINNVRFSKIDYNVSVKNEWNHKIVITKNKSKIISLYIPVRYIVSLLLNIITFS